MLGKLMKYEFKATGRTFLPLYGAILVVALLNRFLGRNTQGVFEELNKVGDFTVVALVALFIALGVITIVATIQRFQKNLLSDEGYLMFTLPVKTRSLILSKMIVAIVWIILSGLVGIAAFGILFISKEFITELMPLLSEFMSEAIYLLQEEVGRVSILVIVQFIVAGFLSYIQFIVSIYLALAIGQFPNFQKHRTAASFIAFFVINLVVNWVLGLAIFAGDFTANVNMNMFIGNLIVLILTVGMFEATNYILRNYLNLE
ncbi:ABC transporter permease [Niameybacter massiliensis]|uniref:ABC transporter permease n=1 Tax=Holtiella tumoricola TaxID=3018743 RepID=A0AA42DL63_9FIRM|nr:ABC transporter permease [Holtiella tumoricola]MDA3731077.1 ABC transporter permease [Holtiella tumoricola]